MWVQLIGFLTDVEKTQRSRETCPPPAVHEAPVVGVYDMRTRAEGDGDWPKATLPDPAVRVDWSSGPRSREIV